VQFVTSTAQTRGTAANARLRGDVVACILWFLFCASDGAAQSGAVPGARYVEKIPGTLITFEMVPVPGGSVTLATADGSRTVQVAPFWMARSETTWDLYDVFVYNFDRSAPRMPGEEAVARPTRPYVLPGDAFGHDGMPALGMSYHAANAFAHWVSVRTGRTYRVPTEAEWEHACRLGGAGDGGSDAIAWTRENAAQRTHAPALKAPDALGLHDMLGNVAEWAAGEDGDSVAKGGAYTDAAERVNCSTRMRQTPAWNEMDPQLPKSRWWLPDATFLGVRLIRVRDDSTSSATGRRDDRDGGEPA
jgi:formylglycine-generating enzyme required for sulfatase activity